METLKLSIREGVARVILNRPEVHNAFNERLIQELKSCFEDLGEDPEVRAVVLTGAGETFSSGADLEWMRGEVTLEEGRSAAHQTALALEAIDRCPRPVVARVHGPALGGGCGLVCAADLAVCGHKASFGFTEVRVGMLPAVIAPFVVRRIGEARARAYFLTGERFGPEEAHRIGLVHRIARDLDDEVERTVRQLLAGSSAAHGAVKTLLQEIELMEPEQRRAATTRAIARARLSEEGREGIQAFLDKRLPCWHPEAGRQR